MMQTNTEINEFLFVTNSMNEKAHDTSQKFQHSKTEYKQKDTATTGN